MSPASVLSSCWPIKQIFQLNSYPGYPPGASRHKESCLRSKRGLYSQQSSRSFGVSDGRVWLAANITFFRNRTAVFSKALSTDEMKEGLRLAEEQDFNLVEEASNDDV